MSCHTEKSDKNNMVQAEKRDVGIIRETGERQKEVSS